MSNYSQTFLISHFFENNRINEFRRISNSNGSTQFTYIIIIWYYLNNHSELNSFWKCKLSINYLPISYNIQYSINLFALGLTEIREEMVYAKWGNIFWPARVFLIHIIV